MNVTPEHLVYLKTAQLRRAAPDAWDEFSSALQNFAGQQLHALANAPIEKLHVAQGRAQALLSLLDMFGKSLEMSDKIRENQRR